ncbi:MAG: hypothetical protein JWQ09_1487 [Segetibacter sp.]|nr:hypothetical protein [Segetibacter sp.]
MKKQLIKAISKKVFTLFFAAFILCATAQSSYALPDSTPAKAAEITYKGLQDSRLVFLVNYKNEQSETFQLIVRNEQNDILYFKQYKAKPLNTKMLFSDVPENGKLTFLIKTGKKEISQAFQINTQVKTMEEFIVKGL